MTATGPDNWRGWIIRPLRHYADFRGRSGRREFWWYCLFLALGYLAVVCAAIVVAIAAEEHNAGEWIGWVLIAGWGVIFVVNFIPGLALTTRRLHDLGLSGVLLLVVFFALLFANVLGWIAYLIIMGLPGQAKSNRWGPPLGASDIAEVFG